MKNNNYNINFNPEELSSEQIQQHQDFDALMEAFQSAPPPEQAPPPKAKIHWLRYAGVAAAAMLAGLLFYFGFAEKTSNTSGMTADNYFKSQPYINPPLVNVKPQYDAKKVDANQGGVFKYENGSKLIVPPAAFIKKDGSVVAGDVEIKYREFHDFVDFFLSGIPMRYDSLGTEYILESAGMVEIFAEQNGQRLNIAPGKTLNVELVSEIFTNSKDRASIPKFNVYELDTEQRNWVYKGVDQIEVLEDVNAILADEEVTIKNEFNTKIEAIEKEEAQAMQVIEKSIAKPKAPLRPERANEDAIVFDLNIEDAADYKGNDSAQQAVVDAQNEVAELKRKYESMLWQIAPNSPPVNENASKVNWDDFTLVPVNDREFDLTFIKDETRLKLRVIPVLSGQEFEQAIAEFNQKFAKYQAALSEREKQLAGQKKELADRIALKRAAAEKDYAERIEFYKNEGHADLASNEMIKHKVVNRFQVSSFGIWNCDRPLPPFLARVNGKFMDQNKKTFKKNTIYLSDKKRNTIATFYSGQNNNNITYDRTSENIMWLVTEENKLAVFKADDFKEIKKIQEGDVTFVMNVVEQPIENEEDVRRILDF